MTVTRTKKIKKIGTAEKVVAVLAKVSSFNEPKSCTRNGEWLGTYYSEALTTEEQNLFGDFEDFALAVLTFQGESIEFAYSR